MLTGERRWLSARRGGMTVLGKVTVPKPINLPSQRLENHGLDPNVEIVPKGTINWGTRSSSSPQNAWASPAQSPPKNGGTGSPSHLNGRPSSSGSGTRPSTAGSDRSQEPVPNVWGPSSRPSSASGILTSNQTSVAAARPRSAEPRPASSQLSRFAEPISENSVTWGASTTMEKLGVSSSKSNNFSLSSGDFPTLGSEKTTDSLVRQGHSSQGRPASASGRATTPKQGSETSPFEDGSINASKERGAAKTSRNDNVLEVEAGDPPGTENWQRETKPYYDQNMAPQQFGPWHGTPHNPPNGVWYRGPFVGGPYVPPGPPGSYPHEPFAYYHPRLPARPAANMQPALQPGSAPSGFFPDKGHSHRPHMPDSYIQPVMPFGPGPYPVQVPYDGYYGPPHVGSCISSEQRPPVMGMATAPCAYNRYPIQSAQPDPGNFHGSSGYGPPSARVKEQGGSGHPHGTRQGPYKVLLKNQDGWDVNESKEKSEHAVSIPRLERGNLSGTPTREIGQEADRRHDEQVSFSKVSSDGVITSSQYDDNRGGHSPLPVGLDVMERTTKINRIDDSLVRKPQTASVPGDDPHQFISIKRNPTLIEKIECLNNKARLTDGRYDEKLKSFRALCTKVEDTPKEAGIDYPNKAPASGMLSPPTLDMNPTGDKRQEAVSFVGAIVSRPVHEPQASVVSVLNSSSDGGMIHRNTQNKPLGVQGRIDNRGKGRSNPPKDEEWRKKPGVADISVEGSSTKDETCNHDALDHHAAIRASEKSNLNKGKAGGDMPNFDQSDHQRAKMREIVIERAKQLQKEEEERTREQKARALAKLEELNKRTLAETSTEKVDHVLPQSGVSQPKGENFEFNTVPMTAANTYSEVVCSASGWDCDIFSPPSGYDTQGHEGSTDLPKEIPLKDPICAQQDTISIPLPMEVETKDVTDPKTSQGQNSIVPKQKQIGPKRKQNTNKNLVDKVISSGDSGHLKSHANVAGDANSLSVELNPRGNTNATDDSLLKHKKKNNRSGKNKHKLDEVSSGSHSPKLVPMDGNSVKPSAESNRPKTSVSVFEVGSVQVPFSIEIAEEAQDSVVPSTDQGWSSSTEVHSVVNNQLKPHPPRRTPKNTQGTRTTEKFHGSDSVVWAPVGSLKKTEDFEDATLNSTIDARPSSVIGRGTQSNHKSRRAEMERYVPKHVAKEAKELSVQGNTETAPSSSVKEVPKPVVNELSLQGNTETPLSSSVNQDAPNESIGRGDSSSLDKEISGSDGLTSGKGGLPVVLKAGESKHNKHGKAQGLWRPRSSGESPVVQPSLEESRYSSGSNKTAQKSFEKHQTSKSEMYLPKEQVKYSDNLNASNSPPISNEPVTEPAVKDNGVTNRGKRQPFKGQKGAGNFQNNSDHNDSHGRDSFEAGSRSSSIESNKLDGRVALGETHAVEKHVIDTHTLSHWQPKYQGSSWAGGQRASSRVGKAPKEYPTQGKEHFASVAGIPNEHHLERKGVDSPKQNPHPVNPSRLKDPPENVSNQHEQSFSGSRRQSYQGRSGRVREVPHGAQSPGVQQQPTPSSERRKHDSQYEYQRARSNGQESIESFEEGPRFTGSRYREKGQRHGGVNSYTQNSGTRMASASRDGEQNLEPVISHF